MTVPAKRLTSVWVVGVLSEIVFQADDVISLQAPSPAAHETAVSIAVEHSAANGSPSDGVQVGVVAAHPTVL